MDDRDSGISTRAYASSRRGISSNSNSKSTIVRRRSPRIAAARALEGKKVRSQASIPPMVVRRSPRQSVVASAYRGRRKKTRGNGDMEEEDGEEEPEQEILLTVPHAKCVSTTRRDCDRLARTAATYLHSFLLPRSRLLVGDVLRSQGDLNRVETRNTLYRRHVRNILLSKTKGLGVAAAAVLDIHSFPYIDSFPSPDSWLEDTINDKIRLLLNGPPELVILDNIPAHTPWILKLVRFLHQNNVRVDYLPGARFNDIVAESRKLGIPAVLIEFYEGLSIPRLVTITRLIASFFSSPQALEEFFSSD